jgi:uncharacterized repeat protein (TIGR03803 family)
MKKFNWGMKACAIVLLLAATAAAPFGQVTVAPTVTFTALHSFDYTDGDNPEAGLVQATDGNFYGTTTGGPGSGTVFKITPDGGLTSLYNFCSQNNCPDGADPQARLVQATNGDFFGTTLEGGGGRSCPPAGCGTVFTITPGGVLTSLHSFGYAHGYPFAGLLQAADGNFYGTTEGDGTPNNFGTVFEITAHGKLTILHSFDFTDGAVPLGGLAEAGNGQLYGTTVGGGANNACSGGCGTVFKITLTGTLTTLYNFCSLSSCPNGPQPEAALVQATDGNFYGTTYFGGTYDSGTVFRITPNGTLTTLHSFIGTDGSAPHAGLVQGTDGNFYGTTVYGGVNNGGTVFKITPSGTLTSLYSFCSRRNCTDGYWPDAGLVQGTNGKFYGTTYFGGNGSCGSGCGTVFSLSVDLGPFVETQPTSGKVGKVVKILGTNLTGATSVAFNDTPATFTVVSGSEITTSVPSGATTGRVWVTLPHGRRSSNVPFTVK